MSAADLSAQIDDALSAFENAAASTRVPDLEPFLPPAGNPARQEAVRELTRVALELRWARGERPDPDEYLARFSELSEPSAIAAIAFEDYRQRFLAGDRPSRDSYVNRYGVDVSDWPNSTAQTERRGPTSFATPVPVGDTPTEIIQVPLSSSDSDWRTTSHQMPEPGQLFAGFRIVSELGRGAFGRVYLAEQTDLANRCVALKVSARLGAEVRTLARLQHTNIVPEYSAHRAPPWTAICMPYFGRTTLATIAVRLSREQSKSGRGIAQIIESRRESRVATDQQQTGALNLLESTTFVDAVLWIGERLADALAHAHERGIIHRDIKPANVLMADDGQPMLLDFNLAADGNESGVERARAGGTLPYMAPEQMVAFAGKANLVDGRADVYSLGVVLYQLLTRRLPYPDRYGHTQIVLTQMQADRSGPIPLLRPFNPDVSPAVESIVRKCLEPDPDRRYPSAAALRDDIARHRNDQPLQTAVEPSWRERVQKWMRRNPRLVSPAAMSAYVAIALLLTAALTVRLSLDARAKRQDAERAEAMQHYEKFQSLAERVKFAAGSPSGTGEVLKLGSEALDRYGATEADWEQRDQVTSLPENERARLRNELGEIAYLTARAASQGKRDVTLAERLNTLAAETVSSDAKSAVDNQRSNLSGLSPGEIANAIGDGGRGDYLRACDLAALGRFREALQIVAYFVAKHPDDFGGWFLKGKCHDVLGQYDDAQFAYSTCAALRPLSPRPLAARGEVALRNKDLYKAKADLDRAVRLDPNLFEARLTRAIVCRNLRQYQSSLSDLDALVDTPGVPTRVYFVRAQVRDLFGDKAGAAADRAEGMKRAPCDPASFVTRGLARATREPNEALADFVAAEKLDPFNVDALVNQAWLLGERMNRTEDAIAATNRLLVVYPDHLNARSGRAVLLARLGRCDEAIAEARKCLVNAPHISAYYKAGCVFAVLSRTDPKYRDEGLRLIATAILRGFGHDDILGDDDLNAFRDDERFRKLTDGVKAMKELGAK